MPVEAIHEHGVVGGYGIDPAPFRQLCTWPTLMVPVATCYPLARCNFPHMLFQASGEVCWRRSFSQAHACDLESTAEQMHVGVHEPGYNHRLPICDYPCSATHQLCHRSTVSHRGNRLTRNGDGLRPRPG